MVQTDGTPVTTGGGGEFRMPIGTKRGDLGGLQFHVLAMGGDIGVAAGAMPVADLGQQKRAPMLGMTLRATLFSDGIRLVCRAIVALLAGCVGDLREGLGVTFGAVALKYRMSAGDASIRKDFLAVTDSYDKRKCPGGGNNGHKQRHTPPPPAEPMPAPQVSEIDALGQALGVQDPALVLQRFFFLRHLN